jgi:peptidylprolyl isomerase
MKKILLIFALLTVKAAIAQNKKEPIVEITTNFGKIKVKLYNETPLHRDNFLKLISKGFYDSLLFHRVINNFMIQGGDPESKRAAKGKALGNGDAGYTIPAEFNQKLYHKKGALAAARLGDEQNPQKNSSGCQFYIVKGNTYAEKDIVAMETRINMQAKQQFVSSYITKPENEMLKNKILDFQKNNQADSLKALEARVMPMIDAEFNKMPGFKYTPEQVKTYTTLGGTPHLDGGYTVFGEVIEGLDIVDKIAQVEKDSSDRPNDDIIMKVKIIE